RPGDECDPQIHERVRRQSFRLPGKDESCKCRYSDHLCEWHVERETPGQTVGIHEADPRPYEDADKRAAKDERDRAEDDESYDEVAHRIFNRVTRGCRRRNGASWLGDCAQSPSTVRIRSSRSGSSTADSALSRTCLAWDRRPAS